MGDPKLNPVESAVRSILQTQPDRRMILAALGNRVARELGVVLRDVTGGLKFKDFLEHAFGPAISFVGSGDKLHAVLSMPSGEVQSNLPLERSDAEPPRSGSSGSIRRRYETMFWSAFMTSLDSDKRRCIQKSAPFSWNDADRDQPLPENMLEIPRDIIPVEGASYHVRKAAIFQAIEIWCNHHSLDPSMFSSSLRHPPTARMPHRNSSGTERLLNLIEKIPESERRHHVLDMGFIYTVLSR